MVFKTINGKRQKTMAKISIEWNTDVVSLVFKWAKGSPEYSMRKRKKRS